VVTYALFLAFDGTDYAGWQRQRRGTTIQSLVEQALVPLEGAPVAVAGCGRTDAGVHSRAFVASCHLVRTVAPAVLQRALNARLPDDVRVTDVRRVADGFHARFSAAGKVYRYRIWNAPVGNPFEVRYAWHVAAPLDVAAMRLAAASLVGQHDFRAFQSAGSRVLSSVRTLWRADVVEREALVAFEVEGDGFLRHMVRAMAGTLVDVGLGRRAPRDMAATVERGDRGAAGPTAPAHGLFLERVLYPEGSLAAPPDDPVT
jgi:tRNA pseudouridine38-40 synthase